MYCKYCGKPIIGSGDVCEECQNKQIPEENNKFDFFDEQPIEENSVEVEQPAEQAKEEQQTNGGYFSYLNKEPSTPKPKKHGFACSIISLVLGFEAISCAIALIFFRYILNDNALLNEFLTELETAFQGVSKAEIMSILTETISSFKVETILVSIASLILSLFGFLGFNKTNKAGYKFKATLILSIIGAALGLISFIICIL